MAQEFSDAQKTIPVVRTHDLWRSLRNDVGHLFPRHPLLHQWFHPERPWSEMARFSFPIPAIDMTEDENGYQVTAELPGLEKQDIKVTVSGDLLILSGEKSYEHDEQSKSRHVSERAFGSFRRALVLPLAADRNAIAASLANGVLTITLPKVAAARSRRKVPVQSRA